MRGMSNVSETSNCGKTSQTEDDLLGAHNREANEEMFIFSQEGTVALFISSSSCTDNEKFPDLN